MGTKREKKKQRARAAKKSGQTKTDAKSNEIPAAQELLSELPLEGALVTMDAMHTQRETAAAIVKKRGTT